MNINMSLAEVIGLGGSTDNVTSFTLRVRADKMPTVTLQRVISNSDEVTQFNDKFELAPIGKLQELTSLLRITEASEQRLRGEAAALRGLLKESRCAKCGRVMP